MQSPVQLVLAFLPKGGGRRSEYEDANDHFSTNGTWGSTTGV